MEFAEKKFNWRYTKRHAYSNLSECIKRNLKADDVAFLTSRS